MTKRARGIAWAAVAAVGLLLGAEATASGHRANMVGVAYGNTKTGKVHIGLADVEAKADNLARERCAAAKVGTCERLRPCNFKGWMAVARFDRTFSYGFTRICGNDGGSVAARTAVKKHCEKTQKGCYSAVDWAARLD